MERRWHLTNLNVLNLSSILITVSNKEEQARLNINKLQEEAGWWLLDEIL
ncbi:MAG: hypothetical protein ABR936_06720 [Bacteroidota bacterium]|jgi:hypothetical protein